jgi:PAS domain S-box-containing protein
MRCRAESANSTSCGVSGDPSRRDTTKIAGSWSPRGKVFNSAATLADSADGGTNSGGLSAPVFDPASAMNTPEAAAISNAIAQERRCVTAATMRSQIAVPTGAIQHLKTDELAAGADRVNDMSASEATREKQRSTVTVDRDGIIHQWGDAVTEVTGHSADETVGRNLNFVIPPAFRKLHWWGFDRAMRRGRLSRPGTTYKVPALRNDGRVVVAHATFDLIPGNGGRTDGAVVTFVGVGAPWQGVAWRAALAPVNLAHRLWRRLRPNR